MRTIAGRIRVVSNPPWPLIGLPRSWQVLCAVSVTGHRSGTVGWQSRPRPTQPEAYAALLLHLHEAHGIGTGL